MNLFFLDRDPVAAAALHSDQHVVKMALETAQILCAVLHRYDQPARYKPTHARHPSVLWTGDSLPHFHWARELGLALCTEYTFRFGKVHACLEVIATLAIPPMPDFGWVDPPQAMPDHYRGPDAVAAYRVYYAGDKASFAAKGPARWTKREKPAFMP
jgi:hypothetical protein